MKKFTAILLLSTSILLFTACSNKVAVAVIGDEGIMRGTATATMSGGHFEVSNQTGTCSGYYDSLTTEPTITMIVQCSNNRKGIAIITRDVSMMSGHGRIRMSDGYEADLIFGTSAEAL